jgi:glycosyltransferase involved in cell wall biosynthesis
MQIGLIAPPWLPVPPPAYGGTESVLDRLARGLQAAGHEVTLATTGDSTCAVPRQWTYRHATQNAGGALPIELRHLIHAYEALRTHDVVHDHTVAGPVLALGYPEVPVVTTNHGPFDPELLDIYRAVQDRVALVAISHHQASTADGVPIAAVIHHGVDPDEFPVGVGDGGYLAYVGRMTAGKGVREACMVARESGLPLHIAAKMREPLEREYFDSEVRPLLSDGVDYVGELAREETAALVGAALALVNPISWPEPFGLVMVEALACGTPVIAFPAGAAPEIVDDGGSGYLPQTLPEMVKRVHQIDQIDRAACRAAVEQRFSTARMVEQHVALYEQVARGQVASG